MNRQVVAGVLGLALAGCAQDGSVASRSRPTISTVELTPPMRSIHEQISQENPEADSDALQSGHPLAATGRPQAARPVGPETETDAETDAGAERTSAREETVPASASEPGAADAPAARVASGRPAPFSRWRGKLRPRAEEARRAAAAAEPVATTDAPADSATPAPSPSPASAGDLPDAAEVAATQSVPATAAPAQADAAPTELPAAAETGPAPSPAADVATASAPGSTETAPTSPADGVAKPPAPESPATPGDAPSALATSADGANPADEGPKGRVRIHLPAELGAGPGVGAAPVADDKAGAGKSLAPGRDPLLGSDPDIMPAINEMPLPGTLKPKGSARPPAPAGSPADLAPPVEPPAATTPVVEPSPAPNGPAPRPEGGVPEVVVPATTRPEPSPIPVEAAPTPAARGVESSGRSAPTTTDPRAAAVPAPVADPLLGPAPDIMPGVGETPAAAPTQRPVPSRRASVLPESGRPPSVSEMTGVTPAQGPAAAATAPPAVPLAVAPAPSPAPAPAAPKVGEGSGAGQAVPAAAGVGPGPGARPQPSTAKPTAPAADPLLGPDPDLMPRIELPPAPATATPAPAGTAAPKPEDAGTGPVELPPMSGPGASAASAPATPVATAGRAFAGFASVPVSAPPGPSGDPGARQAAAAPAVTPTPLRPVDPPAATGADEPTAVRSRVTPRAVYEAGKPAAWVGGEVITLHELKVVFNQRRRKMAAGQQISPETRYMMAKSILDEMVEREMVLQEAKHELKDAKKYAKIGDMADKYFDEEELPPLLRQNSSANVYELKQKMSDRGESLDEVREQFRKEFLFRGYMEQKLGPKMRVDLLEMREYYLNHLKEFDLPASVTWREAVVEVGKSKSRADARARADALLARLRRGEDFATLVKTSSDGPNRSDGGLWQTAPGSYAVPAVNAALETLPAGQLSPVIEGPTSYHIVRVEGRRKAGPATFAEVQDQVRKAIRMKKIREESNAYLDRLRKRTVVRTVFDAPPPITRTSAEVLIPPLPLPPRR